ncbi:ras guanine nucleotide exchange factor E-like [Salmo salar]|uniref:Ras guanine nucleotide exchange factor E-like n=1 Tax=Salmo salar TaxID=8030 RepID=A0ABM3F569_SALSA|nr:ras guanine nucleotide exchange factor E-like [Salmo salar]
MNGVAFRINITEVTFVPQDASQCRQKCTELYNCQYFTFVGKEAKIDNTNRDMCFLKASTGDRPVTIQYLQHATSGYALRNCSGKVTYSAKKYTLVQENENWNDAKEYCRQHYTNLSIVHTEEDWKAIQSSLGKPDPNEKWKWSDGEDFMFLNWATEFNKNMGHDCVISTSSHWQAEDCHNQKQYVCQQLVHHENGITEKEYELMNGSMQWMSALENCKSTGRVLASICNQKEQVAFDEVAKDHTWIGLKYNNNTWNWSSGEPFQKWDHKMHVTGANCAMLNSKNDRQWTPENCSTQKAFLCYGDERPSNTTGDLTTPVTPETTSPTSTGPPSIKTSTTTSATLLPPTNSGQSTTSPTTTTNGQSTTSRPTNTNGKSTISPPTTTNGQPTTSPTTTTNGQSTTSRPTTTNGKSTISPPTTTNGQPTTSPTTTTNGQSTTSRPTTTNGQFTTSPPTTNNGKSTTSPTTTTNGQSTTSPPTTTNGQSTTSQTTTTNKQSTTSPPTTTIGQSTTPSTSTSSGQLTSLGPTSPDRKPTSSPSSAISPLHPDYLHYFNESKSWINALKFCKSRHSNLVHITNQTVQTDLTQLLANVELPCGGVWIGLERSIFEWSAPWLWTSGDVDKVVKYSEWHSCFPLNPMNYHCGKMVWVDNGELKWLDASCHQELTFICQDLH